MVYDQLQGRGKRAIRAAVLWGIVLAGGTCHGEELVRRLPQQFFIAATARGAEVSGGAGLLVVASGSDVGEPKVVSGTTFGALELVASHEVKVSPGVLSPPLLR